MDHYNTAMDVRGMYLRPGRLCWFYMSQRVFSWEAPKALKRRG